MTHRGVVRSFKIGGGPGRYCDASWNLRGSLCSLCFKGVRHGALRDSKGSDDSAGPPCGSLALSLGATTAERREGLHARFLRFASSTPRPVSRHRNRDGRAPRPGGCRCRRGSEAVCTCRPPGGARCERPAGLAGRSVGGLCRADKRSRGGPRHQRSLDGRLGRRPNVAAHPHREGKREPPPLEPGQPLSRLPRGAGRRGRQGPGLAARPRRRRGAAAHHAPRRSHRLRLEPGWHASGAHRHRPRPG